MAESKTLEASASIASIPVATSSVSQDIELAPVNAIATVAAEEDASRSKFRIIAIMTALYVRPPFPSPSQPPPYSQPKLITQLPIYSSQCS